MVSSVYDLSVHVVVASSQNHRSDHRAPAAHINMRIRHLSSELLRILCAAAYGGGFEKSFFTGSSSRLPLRNSI